MTEASKNRYGYAVELAPLGSDVARDLETCGWEPVSVFVAIVKTSDVMPPQPVTMCAYKAKIDITQAEFEAAMERLDKAMSARNKSSLKL